MSSSFTDEEIYINYMYMYYMYSVHTVTDPDMVMYDIMFALLCIKIT